MFKRLREDIKAVQARDPASRSGFEIFLCYPCVHALFWFRFASWLHRHHCRLLARMVSQMIRNATGIEIHPGATIGRRLFIDHGMGVVIGETTEIGDDVIIYQGVTLGGTGKDTGKRHPTIGNGVMISAGAKVLGPITIGDHSKIGAQAVVLKDVPPHCTVVGVPGRVVRCYHQASAPEELDQVKLPDPILEEINILKRRITELETELHKLKTEER